MSSSTDGSPFWPTSCLSPPVRLPPSTRNGGRLNCSSRALKQHLKIKTFVGTSENAVQVQIWIALIAMLLLKLLQLKSPWPWSLSNLAALLRFNFLTYRDLWRGSMRPLSGRCRGPSPRKRGSLRHDLGQHQGKLHPKTGAQAVEYILFTRGGHGGTHYSGQQCVLYSFQHHIIE